MSPREEVLKYYPKAQAKLRPNGKKYYEIWSNNEYLGQGKTSKAAWKAASRNLNS